MSDTNSELRAENERLLNLNHRLSQQVISMSATLEAGRRELLATGWDACTEKVGFITSGLAPKLVADLKADNPYRKPVPDFTGAIICKTGDGQ